MLNRLLFAMLVMLMLLGCDDGSARDNRVGDIGIGSMPDNGLYPAPVNDINVFSSFPSIGDYFANLQASRTFGLVAVDGGVGSSLYTKLLSTAMGFEYNDTGYVNHNSQKVWMFTQVDTNISNIWADTAQSILSHTPIADLLAEFPPIADAFSDVKMVSYTLTFNAVPTNEITSYRGRMSPAFSCGGTSDEYMATTCTAALRNAYLTFEIRNAGKSLVWSVGYK